MAVHLPVAGLRPLAPALVPQNAEFTGPSGSRRISKVPKDKPLRTGDVVTVWDR